MTQTHLYAVGSTYLLGLAHGHWEIPPDDKNNAIIYSASKDEPSINLGIAIVIPAPIILEVLNHPELVARREACEQAIVQQTGGAVLD